MDRRNFLQTIICVLIGVGLLKPMKLKSASTKLKLTTLLKPSKRVRPRKFDPNAEYGNSVKASPLFKIANSVDEGLVWDFLKKTAYNDMLKVVPEEYRHRVQFRTKVIDGKTFALCWYYPRSGKHPVRLNGQDKIICYHNHNLPLPTQNELGNYGVI